MIHQGAALDATSVPFSLLSDGQYTRVFIELRCLVALGYKDVKDLLRIVLDRKL